MHSHTCMALAHALCLDSHTVHQHAHTHTPTWEPHLLMISLSRGPPQAEGLRQPAAISSCSSSCVQAGIRACACTNGE